MLDTSHSNLVAEIESAKALRHQRLSMWDEWIHDYHGPSYEGQDWGHTQENTAFDVMASVNPQLVFNNPKAKLTSSRPEYQKRRVQALEFALNRWILDTDPRPLYEEVAADFQFAYGVILTSPAIYKVHTKKEDKDEDPTYRPKSIRVSPREFVIDPKAKTWREARWMGHPVTIDKDDLLEKAERENKESKDRGEEETWDLTAINSLQQGEGENEIANQMDASVNAPPRKSVTYYELYIPEIELDESLGSDKGFNGSWYCVTLSSARKNTPKGQQQAAIRKPRPAFVPRWGPYSLFGAYIVPDKQHPLSLLCAIDGVHRALNRQADANLRAMERRKALAAVASTEPDAASLVEDAPDGSVVVFPNLTELNNNLKEFEIGGVTESGLRSEQITKDKRDRALGSSSAVGQGVPQANVTATADVLANRATTIRLSHLQQKFQGGVRKHLRTVLWYLNTDSRVVLYLGSPASEYMGIEDPVYIGGLYEDAKDRAKTEFDVDYQPEDDGERNESLDEFDLLEVDVEPYSMTRADDPSLQARSMQMLQIYMQLAPVMVQAPWVRWKTILEEVGNTFNMPGFGDAYNEELAIQVAGQLLQAQLEPEPNVKGRLASDVGSPAKVSGPNRAPFQEANLGGV